MRGSWSAGRRSGRAPLLLPFLDSSRKDRSLDEASLNSGLTPFASLTVSPRPRTMSTDGKLFDDLFVVSSVDKGGKKFDRGP